MSTPDSPRKPKARRDGWTPERQLDFLAENNSVAAAAASVGMSREGAYRLRTRADGALFAALWDRARQPDSSPRRQVHAQLMSDSQIARLLGTHFRRKLGDYSTIGSPAAQPPGK